MSMLKPAQPRKIATLPSHPQTQIPAAADLKPGLNRQTYTNKAMGSPVTIAIDSTLSGSGGPATTFTDSSRSILWWMAKPP
jgi:hypothetical protein